MLYAFFSHYINTFDRFEYINPYNFQVMSIPPRPLNKGVLDLGLVGVSSTTRATIVVRNFNPVPICIRGSGSNLPGTAVQLLGCSAQSPSALELGGGTVANITACVCIFFNSKHQIFPRYAY